MALSKIDIENMVTGELTTTNGGTGTTSYTAGITEADRWRVTSSFDLNGSTDPVQSNLERVDGTAESYFGTGMSVSSGIWTFPSTGYWLVDARYDAYSRVASDGTKQVRVEIQATTDNSSYTQIGVARSGLYEEDAYGTGYISCLIDVTNTTNVKVKFKVFTNANSNFQCSSSNTGLGFGFYRLGDT